MPMEHKGRNKGLPGLCYPHVRWDAVNHTVRLCDLRSQFSQ